MKTFYYIFSMMLLLNCSSTKLIDSWVNKEHKNYKPKKVLIVGLTDNLTARKIYEEKLALEFKHRNIDAIESHDAFESSFISEKQTEDNIKKEVKRLKENGFNAILISAVKGVDEKKVYSADLYKRDRSWRRFGPYYYFYQNMYFDSAYYEKYNIYNIEATLYNLNENNDKSLIWVASYSIVDPKKINKSVKHYVRAIIISLEKEAIIPSIN